MSESVDVPSVLLGVAADDEFMARSLLPIEGVTDAGLGFHTQQAVEKAIKAVLAVKGVEFPYSHDLNGLLRLCRESGIDIPDDLSGVGVFRCLPSGCGTALGRRLILTATRR